jgi:hypothetical protein
MLPNRRFTHRPALQQKQRNRGLLLDALEAGLAVQKIASTLYLVESSALNGSYYQVMVCSGGNTLPESFACSCDWSAKQVAVAWAVGSDVLPCKHELLVFWYRLSASRRTALSMADPALLAAEMAGGAAHAARLTSGGHAGQAALPQRNTQAPPAQDDPAPHNLIQAAALFVAPGQGRD